MNLLIDTNIVLSIVRNKSGHKFIEYLTPNDETIYVSFVSLAEIHSIAFQNKWGYSKMQILESLFDKVRVIEISDLLLPTYVGIDAFSQRTHPEYTHYPFKTPRNMGKNDLWIAATASILNLQLITTDGDFDHLNDTFLSVKKILPYTLQQFFN